MYIYIVQKHICIHLYKHIYILYIYIYVYLGWEGGARNVRATAAAVGPGAVRGALGA